MLPTAWEAKVRVDAESEICVPTPVRCTTCGLAPSLSVTVISPYRVPVVDGVKVTVMLQVPPAATAVWQVFVWV